MDKEVSEFERIHLEPFMDKHVRGPNTQEEKSRYEQFEAVRVIVRQAVNEEMKPQLGSSMWLGSKTFDVAKQITEQGGTVPFMLTTLRPQLGEDSFGEFDSMIKAIEPYSSKLDAIATHIASQSDRASDVRDYEELAQDTFKFRDKRLVGTDRDEIIGALLGLENIFSKAEGQEAVTGSTTTSAATHASSVEIVESGGVINFLRNTVRPQLRENELEQFDNIVKKCEAHANEIDEYAKRIAAQELVIKIQIGKRGTGRSIC